MSEVTIKGLPKKVAEVFEISEIERGKETLYCLVSASGRQVTHYVPEDDLIELSKTIVRGKWSDIMGNMYIRKRGMVWRLFGNNKKMKRKK